jgi:hypothetical protein
MCYLTTVVGSFHGRVLAARLGSEGVIVVLRGSSEGALPFQSTVDVLVPAHQLSLAREILLADAVDDAFGAITTETGTTEMGITTEMGATGAGDPGLTPAEASLPDDLIDAVTTWQAPAGQGVASRPAGEPSETFTLHSGAAAGTGRRQKRSRAMPTVVVVAVVTMMVVAACVAAVVR